MDFVRFPRTPHLAWLGGGDPRDDKVLTPAESRAFLSHEVVVEEKVDGANLGFSVDQEGVLRAHNRGSFIEPDGAVPQFRPLFRWMAPHRISLAEALGRDLVLFGEWCYAAHSVVYTRLPDWFLGFDVYDRRTTSFWSTARRNALLAKLGLVPVPLLARGGFDLEGVRACMRMSRVTDAPAEGIYLRWDHGEELGGRAKLVRPDFVQSIEEHWSRRELRRNSLESGVVW